MRAWLICVMVSFASCQCGFEPVPECGNGACDDAGVIDAGPQPVCDGGGSNDPHLCLEPAQPAFCPREWPIADNGLACPTAGVCSYVYPVGTHPSGCGAECTRTPTAPRQADGGLMWNVNPCI